ncbi:radical SAM protein [Candidatus Pacearchaeota archaeon]|nr:radical SAM protein [Candidatus Pacearchaeota archaeon]
MALSESSVKDNSSLERRVISVEISPKCNLRCPECNVGKRLHVNSNERRNDPELVKKIIEHVPYNSTLLFVGLGEPTIPYSQERIGKILHSREDLKGYIQTNGSYPLKEELEGLIKQGRLEVGLSLDQQHFIGGQKKLRIQPEYVESISTIVTDEETQSKMPQGFPNLNRILITPLLVGKKIANSWERLSETVVAYQGISNGVTIYTELPPPVREDNIKLFEEAERDLEPLTPEGWRKSKEHGFYVDMEPTTPRNSMRILIDGNYINIPILAEGSWQEVDKYSKPLTDLPKVFDLEIGRYE